MEAKLVKRYTVLGILFILPVLFLLMLLPAKHNYTALDIVEVEITEFQNTSPLETSIQLKDHITVLGFLGKKPIENIIPVSNLKELIYDKFRGFKKFQIVLLAPEGAEDEVEKLKREINEYESLKYFHFVFTKPSEILGIFNTLKTKTPLDSNFSTAEVFLIDKELNQRGRIEDKISNSGKIRKTAISLPSYNTIEVAEIKNKMSEDLRILFTEYRQKRKGDFNSTIRRAEDISLDHGTNN